jgi:hypothetical protein
MNLAEQALGSRLKRQDSGGDDDDEYFVLWEIILTNPTECVRNHQSK